MRRLESHETLGQGPLYGQKTMKMRSEASDASFIGLLLITLDLPLNQCKIKCTLSVSE
jgi:hypothetical protein